MAKKDYDKIHRVNIDVYAKKIQTIYDSAVKEASSIGATIPNFNPDKMFSFTDYPITATRVDALVKSLQSNLDTAILNGIKHEWTLSNNKNNELSQRVFGNKIGKLSKSQEQRYFNNNLNARDAFIQRKTAGLNLSDRVWKYTDQFKEEIELGLDLGLRDRLSAPEMARDLKSYLQNPDKLFRRVRDEHGILQLSKSAKAFNPGQGVYRSSVKNAQRLARTETNMAYRTADHERWQQFDFVVGIEVRRSNNRSCVCPLCDSLSGEYPKEFKFTGWHPQCRCYAIPILKTVDELQTETEQIIKGEPTNTDSVNAIGSLPNGYTQWVDDNAHRFNSKNTPYFIKDNAKYTGVRPRAGSVGAFTGTKLGRTATKAAIKEYEEMKPTILTKEQQANTTEISEEMGLKDCKPMTFIEADDGRANINFGKGQTFSENCQCCVAVHEARLRGLNLTARAYSSAKDSIQYQLGESFQDIWISPKTGKTPSVTILKAGTDEILYGKLDKAMNATGRYHIGINQNNGQGHVITAERLSSGKVIFYDAQSGGFLNIKEYTALESFEIIKVDKLLFRIDLIRKISQII